MHIPSQNMSCHMAIYVLQNALKYIVQNKSVAENLLNSFQQYVLKYTKTLSKIFQISDVKTCSAKWILFTGYMIYIIYSYVRYTYIHQLYLQDIKVYESLHFFTKTIYLHKIFIIISVPTWDCKA